LADVAKGSYPCILGLAEEMLNSELNYRIMIKTAKAMLIIALALNALPLKIIASLVNDGGY